MRATKPLIDAESQKGAHANLQGRKSGENEKEQAADQETGLGTLLGLEAPILLTVPAVPTPRTELAKQHPQREWAQTGWVSAQQGNRMVDPPIQGSISNRSSPYFMASPRRRIISLSVHALRQFDSNVCQLYPKGAMMKENASNKPYHARSIAPNVIERVIVNDL